MLKIGVGFQIIIFLAVFNTCKTNQNKITFASNHIPTTRLYDPNYGFKQYWPGGDWKLFGKTLRPPTQLPFTKKGQTFTTTKKSQGTPIQVCGDDCPEVYRNITQVCVVPTDAVIIEKMDKYKTMSYCKYLVESNPKCTYSAWKGIRLAFVHVGPCLQNYVQDYRTPSPCCTFGQRTHPRWYTPDAFELDPKVRVAKFGNKFYDPKEWTKFYPGTPYPKPFQNFP